MKKYTYSLMALLVASSVFATETAPVVSTPVSGGRKGQPTAAQKAKMLEKYDVDGDGVLSKTERAALTEQMRGRRGGKEGRKGSRERGHKGGRGRMSAEKHRSVIEKYDTDGDGVLSEVERATAKATKSTEGALKTAE